MAITNIQIASTTATYALNIDITDGSGNDRKAVVGLTQERNTVNIGVPTLNGVSGTLVAQATYNPAALGNYAGLYEWLDADLPASGGTYAIACSGGTANSSVAAFSCSGAKQSACADPQSSQATSAASPVGATLTADAGSIAIMVCCDAYSSAGGALTTGSGQTDILAPTFVVAAYGACSYDNVDLDISYTRSRNNGWAWAAGAIEPSTAGPTINSVDTDNDITPGQTNVTCDTTDMGAGTAARITSGTKSIPMTGYNASATAPDFDVPDLASCMAQGIDIGTTVTLEIIS